MEEYDAAVIGGGPAGSHAARKLAEAGYRVVVLERGEKVGQKPCCTGIIGRECMEKFAIPGEVALYEARSASFFSPGGASVRLRKENTQAYIVDRAALDNELAARAREKGAEYYLSCRVEDIAPSNGSLKVGFVHEGRTSAVRCKIAAICTGFGSPLAHRVGLGKVNDFAVGCQVEVNTEVDEVEVYFGRRVAPGFFAWLVPTSPGKGLAGLLARRNPGEYLGEFVSRLRENGKIGGNGKSGWTEDFVYGGIPLRTLPRTYAERVVVIGDAAGQVKPTTGGGIYYALLCADIAAQTMDQALKLGDQSEYGLAAYERGWRGLLENELRMGALARSVYERLSDDQLNSIFDHFSSNRVNEHLLESPDFAFDWHGKALVAALKHMKLGRATWMLAKSLLAFR